MFDDDFEGDDLIDYYDGYDDEDEDSGGDGFVYRDPGSYHPDSSPYDYDDEDD